MNYNKEVIYSIIKKYFSLEPQGLELVKSNLESPQIDDAYMALGLDSEHRKRWSLAGLESEVDQGWINFERAFPTFISHYSMKYEDFRNNKITIDKNSVKLRKALVAFYLENKENSTGYFIGGMFRRISGLIGSDIMKEIDDVVRGKEAGKAHENAIYHKFSSVYSFYAYYRDRYRHVPETKIEEAYRDFMVSEINSKMDGIGVNKLPSSSKLELVLSCNYEDWFFCSTGNSWSSCLSLDGNYGYWAGLPGLTTDRNRAMLYITNGEKKRPIPYIDEKVEVDKVIARSWVLLTESNEMNLVRFYPFKILEKESIGKITGITFFDNDECSERCKHEEIPVFHTNGLSSNIYKDNTQFEKNSYGDGKIYSCFTGSGTQYISKRTLSFEYEDYYDGIEGGLRTLVSEDSSLENYEGNKAYCYMCDREIYGEEYLDHRGNVICERCYENEYSDCCVCGRILPNDDAMYTKNGDDPYCDCCYEERCGECSECHEGFEKDNLIQVEGTEAYVCTDCLANNTDKYGECESCNFTFPVDKLEITQHKMLYCEDCVGSKEAG